MVETKPTWSYRYVNISLVLIGLCFPAIWFYVGYRGHSLNEMLSFTIADGWCDVGSQSIGQHCFGDYAAVDAGLRSDGFWNLGLPTSTAYPPLSLLPSIAFISIGRITGSWALGRDLFLLLLAGSILSPALWVSRGGWGRRGSTALVIIGLATAPFLVILDRGNTTGLLVAPLLGVALAYMDGRQERMLILIIVCALLKPQMILLVLLFLVYRRYSYLVLGVAASAGLTLAGFFLFPGSVSTNATNWFHLLRGYQDYQAASSPYPYNLGVGRSVLTIFDLSHVESLLGEASRTDLASWLTSHGGVLSGLLVLLTVATLLLRGQQSNRLYPLLAVCILIAIAPQTSFSYYLGLLLVPAAFVLRDPSEPRRQRDTEVSWFGILDTDPVSDSRWARVSRWSLILGVALVLTPLVIPMSSVPLFNAHVEAGVEVGVLQLLWGPILLALLFLSISMASRGRARVPPVALDELREDAPDWPAHKSEEARR